MAIETITPGHHVPEHAWEHTALRTELLLAAGAVVLSIVGMAGVLPMYLAAISIMALGAVLLFQGATVAWHFSDLLHQAGASKAGVAEVGGGITTDFLAGMAGIVLGVLGLIGIENGLFPIEGARVFALQSYSFLLSKNGQRYS